MKAPKLVVFDLDFTLWNCGGLWVDCVDYPFSSSASGKVMDSSGRSIRLYEEVPAIIEELQSEGVSLALASRTSQPSWAIELLQLMGIRDWFQYEEIYPGSKVAHFESLAARSRLKFAEMLFFDDEDRNIREVSKLGVSCLEVRGGLNRSQFELGRERFSSR
ncbi:MAG: magnesium-dependent phosphatase-1 [Verrucomicrobiota bacterium]